MILSKPDIEQALASGGLVIDPEPDGVDQVSVNLHIGRRFATFKTLPSYLPRVRIRDSLFSSAGETLWETIETDEFLLEPQEFVLAQTLERVVMPSHLMGFVEGRSSWARTGISVHLAAPKIDPGFDGTITLEMTNHGKVPVELSAGQDAPAQLIFMELKQPLSPSDLYGTGPRDTFQFQDAPLPRKS